MFFVIPINNEPTLCPDCGKKEHKVEVCGHCNYKYPEEDLTGVGVFFGWAMVIAGLAGLAWTHSHQYMYSQPEYSDYLIIPLLFMGLTFLGLLALSLILWLVASTTQLLKR